MLPPLYVHIFFLQKNCTVLLRAAFLALPPFDVQESLSIKASFNPIRDVTSLLSSHDPNDLYLFLTCLDRVNPVFWAGTSVDFPAVLKEWEVGQVMHLLDSSESLVRKMVRALGSLCQPMMDFSLLFTDSQTFEPNRRKYSRLILFAITANASTRPDSISQDRIWMSVSRSTGDPNGGGWWKLCKKCTWSTQAYGRCNVSRKQSTSHSWRLDWNGA